MITIGTQVLTHAHPGFAMHCVTTRDDWSRVRSLRYVNLLNQGDILANPERSYEDGHDRGSEGASFLLTRDRRATGTVRATLDSPLRCGVLPSLDAFGRERIRALRGPHAATARGMGAYLRLMKGTGNAVSTATAITTSNSNGAPMRPSM